ncbi:uncharacterized protein LOC105386095 isoform X1 [Plutella xylostella]|uniref:uncharacterized protein LOC105386095 isoform X1 n=1 Tax=Plutella xylostella TaxID=51655 RepID=UPI002032D0F2|nr:uncharacterized protein LOC105386095 isoform X1 [Plutella xylostella]
MIRTGLFVVLFAFVQVKVLCQEPPPQCRGPPPVRVAPHTCCKMPQIFKDEDFASCGFERRGEGPPAPPAGPPAGGPPARPPRPDCTKEVCMLKKNNLMKDDETIDFEAVAAFIDQLVDENPEFKDAAEKAKENCAKEELPGPPFICLPQRMLHCISTTLLTFFFQNCPKWEEEVEGCSALKTHFEECKPFFNQ